MVLGKDMGPTVQVDIVLVQHLLNFWDEQGIDVVPVLVSLGISDASPLPPWVSADKLRNAQASVFTGRESTMLGFETGRYLAARHLPMSELISCAENLAQGLPAAIRFAHRTVGIATLEIKPIESGVELLPKALDGSELTVFEKQQTLAALTVLCRDTLGAACSPADLHMTVDDELDTDAAEALLGIPVVRGEYASLSVSAAAWLQLNPNHQALVYSNTLRELQRKEQKLAEHLTLYSELQDIIEACLLRRHVTQEDVAGQLGISVRNLQRRLKALGTTYQMLLDESRQNLAMKLIRDESVPLYEIAYMVGYAEPSAFYKAFRRWTGATPGDYRQAQSDALTDA
jgi:AraC-like DNA-binding protein